MMFVGAFVFTSAPVSKVSSRIAITSHTVDRIAKMGSRGYTP